MNIPSVVHGKFVTKEGELESDQQLFMSTLIDELQENLSPEGYKIPQLTTDVISQLNTDQSAGRLIYDSDTDELKININGVFRVIPII